MKTLLLANVASTLIMTGVIWMVQIVHYPLFNRVGTQAFPRYEADHSALITVIVGPLMIVEFFTALLLLMTPPKAVSPTLLWVGFGLVCVVWASTLFLQLPQHSRLSLGFDAEAYRALVGTNWIRTIAWTVRAGIMLWIIAKLFELPA